MQNSPAFQLYVRDLLADTRMRLLSDGEFRCYIELLCYCWEADGLPEDPAKLARLVGYAPADFEAVWAVLGEFFAVVVLADGKRALWNLKLFAQREHQRETRDKRSKAAKSRWSDDVDGRASASAVHRTSDAFAFPDDVQEDAPESCKPDASAYADGCANGDAKGMLHARVRAAEAEAVEVEEGKAEAAEGKGGAGGNPRKRGSGGKLTRAERALERVRRAQAGPVAAAGGDGAGDERRAGPVEGAAGAAERRAVAVLVRCTRPEAGDGPLVGTRRPPDAKELAPGVWGRILEAFRRHLGDDEAWVYWRRLLRPLWFNAELMVAGLPGRPMCGIFLDAAGQALQWACEEIAGGDVEVRVDAMSAGLWSDADLSPDVPGLLAALRAEPPDGCTADADADAHASAEAVTV